MTAADWIALLGIALPLCAKVAVDVAASLTARKHTALANIVGMAGRQAASAARALATTKPQDVGALERTLITSATETVVSEMGGSMQTLNATPGSIARIVQGELDKLVVAPVAVVPLLPPVAASPVPV